MRSDGCAAAFAHPGHTGYYPGAANSAARSYVTRMAQPVFHGPDHDHERCTADALAHAEALCAQRSQRLTPIRRQVLEVLLESHKPLGAYEIMDRAAAGGGSVAPSGTRPAPSGTRPAPSGIRLAPITIYRALDFLIANELVHRIASRNAFLACVHTHESGALVTFLICESCGTVGEAPAAEVSRTLAAAAQGVGFTPKMSVIEITGLCAHCRDQHASA